MISSCPCWLCFHLLSCSNCNPWHHRFSFLTSLCIFLFRFLEWGGWCWTMLPFGSATRIIPFSALQWPSDFVWDWSSDSHRNFPFLFSPSFLSPQCTVWESWKSFIWANTKLSGQDWRHHKSVKSHDLYTEGLLYWECIDFLSWSFIIPPILPHFEEENSFYIKSSHVTIRWLSPPSPQAVTEMLPLVTLCPLHGPMFLLTLCAKKRAHSCSPVPLESSTCVQREGLGNHWAKLPFPTATVTSVPFESQTSEKRTMAPNSSLGHLTAVHDLRLRRSLKVWDRFSQGTW